MLRNKEKKENREAHKENGGSDQLVMGICAEKYHTTLQRIAATTPSPKLKCVCVRESV
jgi:hypothetical protein